MADDSALAPFLGTWTLMMAAMMLPSAAPMILLHRVGAEGSRVQREVRSAAFVAGYLLVWGAVGIAVWAAALAAAQLVPHDGLRLRGKTGSHEARFDYPGLPAEFVGEARVIRAARRARNTALYDEADRVPESMATDTIRAAERLIAAARRVTAGARNGADTRAALTDL